MVKGQIIQTCNTSIHKGAELGDEANLIEF